jgi:hypothetical protein
MKEEKLQIAISTYLKAQYPDVYFMSDSSGLRLPMGLAIKAKKQRSKHAQLDLVILEPRGLYHGLIIELKKDVKEVYKINGEFRKSEHIEAQNKSIEHLKSKRYLCCYCFGFDDTKLIIDLYLKLKSYD